MKPGRVATVVPHYSSYLLWAVHGEERGVSTSSSYGLPIQHCIDQSVVWEPTRVSDLVLFLPLCHCACRRNTQRRQRRGRSPSPR